MEEKVVFSQRTNGYPVLAPFTSFGAHTSVYDNRPGSGYSMDIYPDGTVSVSSVGFSLPGDYNRDGAVDAADYVAWRKAPSNFGGDPGGYNSWRTHFGQTTGGEVSMGAASNIAAPEPGSFALLFSAVPALLGRRKYPQSRSCPGIVSPAPERAVNRIATQFARFQRRSRIRPPSSYSSGTRRQLTLAAQPRSLMKK